MKRILLVALAMLAFVVPARAAMTNKSSHLWIGAGNIEVQTNSATITATNFVALKIGDALPSLTGTTATGDVRQLYFSLCEMMWQRWQQQTSLPHTNTPTKMTVNGATSYGGTTKTHTYTFQFTVDVPVTFPTVGVQTE